MPDVKIFVITHKVFKIPQIEDYYTLIVGAKGKNIEWKYDYRDDEGENISKKNPNYCELTGLYWIWKNINADIVGLCHYRRYFTTSLLSNSTKFILSSNQIIKLMNKYDVIIPERIWHLHNMNIVGHAPNKNDLQEMREAIKALYPEYVDEYENYLNQRSMFPCNMCIMKKNLLDQYCEWIFNILFYIEDRHDMENEDPYRKRLFGFLSERLLYVWLIHNVSESRIKEIRIVNTEVKSNRLIKCIKNELKRGIAALVLVKDFLGRNIGQYCSKSKNY